MEIKGVSCGSIIPQNKLIFFPQSLQVPYQNKLIKHIIHPFSFIVSAEAFLILLHSPSHLKFQLSERSVLFKQQYLHLFKITTLSNVPICFSIIMTKYSYSCMPVPLEYITVISMLSTFSCIAQCNSISTYLLILVPCFTEAYM